MLLSPYALDVFGGVQEQALAMSRELSSRGERVVLFAPHAADATDYQTGAEVRRIGKVHSIAANGSRAPLNLSWSDSREVARQIRELQPRVIHFHEPFAPLLGWATLRHHRAPSVATFHRSGTGIDLRIGGPLLRRWRRHLDVNAAVSEAAARTAEAAYGISCDVLFNGFDVERFRAVARSIPSQPTILFLGRLEARKGAATLVSAVLDQHQSGDAPWRLLLAGDGPEMGALRALAGGDRDIEFLGRVSDERKRELLRSASLLVAPAWFGESFGMVLLEAMAAETTVVASDITGYREASGGMATLAPPRDAAALRRAIDSALSEGVRHGALEHAQNWSMSKLVDAYEALYERAARQFSH